MIRQQSRRRREWSLGLLVASLLPAGTALAQSESVRSVDGSHRGVGYDKLELDKGVTVAPAGGHGNQGVVGPAAAPGNGHLPPGTTSLDGPPRPAPRPEPATPAQPTTPAKPAAAAAKPTAPAQPTAPYRTTRTYEPGDGYRYPLYYNPATGGYFYHPVRR